MYQRLVVKGSPYQMGVTLGEHFKRLINEDINKYVEMLKDEKMAKIVDKTIEHIKTALPNCYEELRGRANGASVDEKALILMYCPEIYTKLDGCTTAIMKKDDRILFSHNEDDRGYNHEKAAIVKYEYEDHWVVSFSVYHKLTGSCFGYNSYGLIFSCNYLFHDHVQLDNLSRYIVSRVVIESKSIDESIEKLRKNKTASPFSYNVVDMNKNEAVNIENDFDREYITKIDDRFARSNHFLNKENVKMSENSKWRNIFAKERIAKLDDRADIFAIRDVLRYEDPEYVKSILMDPLKYPTIENSTTAANISFDTFTKEILICDYTDHTCIKLDYEDFSNEQEGQY